MWKAVCLLPTFCHICSWILLVPCASFIRFCIVCDATYYHWIDGLNLLLCRKLRVVCQTKPLPFFAFMDFILRQPLLFRLDATKETSKNHTIAYSFWIKFAHMKCNLLILVLPRQRYSLMYSYEYRLSDVILTDCCDNQKLQGTKLNHISVWDAKLRKTILSITNLCQKNWLQRVKSLEWTEYCLLYATKKTGLKSVNNSREKNHLTQKLVGIWSISLKSISCLHID